MKLVAAKEDQPAQAAVAQAGGDHHPLAPHRRVVRSFVRRAGRLTTGQARAIGKLAPQFLLPYQAELLDFNRVWARVAPTVLEIGFGMGDATAQIAEAMPGVNFLGCEVHEPGVGALLRQIDERGLGNVRIIMHDAVQVIDDMLPAASLAGVHIYFPDPWHKKRHHKRRLVQPPLIARLVQRLQPGGYIHCATDWEPYAQQMLQVLGAESLLQNTSISPDGFVPRPAWRPQTRFENRGMRLGHGVWDLVFRKIQGSATNPSADAA